MNDVTNFVGDSYRNLVAGLGTARDKVSAGHYMPTLLTHQQLIDIYRSSWLARKIIDIIPEDAFREWRSWNAEKEQITKIEDEEKRLNLKETLRSAMRSARLFGFAAIHFAMEGDDEENLIEPIDPNSYGLASIQHLTLLPRQMLTVGPNDENPLSPFFGHPLHYEVKGTSASTTVKIHPSRLIILTGQQVPDGGYYSRSHDMGDSVLQSINDAIMKADSTSANVASLVFEAKIDVVKIEGLNRDIVRPGYEEQMLARFALAGLAKSNSGTLILDKTEEYESKHFGFGQLPEIMDRFFQNVSGAADIPMTRLYGMAPAGLNATGENDLKNYYDRIKIMQELEIDPRMSIFNQVLKVSALGNNDAKIWHEWRPLWQMSEKELIEVGKGITSMAVELVKNNIINPEAITEAASNALIEYGVFPGLESAIEEFGAEPPEASPEELAAAMGQMPGQRPKPRLVTSSDETPKRRMTREQLEFWKEYLEGQGFDTNDPEFDPFLDPDIEIVDDDKKSTNDYNPGQPRAPAGTPDGGRWTKGGAGAAGGTAGGQSGTGGGRSYRETDPAAYEAVAKAAKASMGEVGKQVTIAEGADAYFVAGNGMSAFAMRGNDFIGVVNNKGNPERGVVGDMLKVAEGYAKANNYTELTLDCFDGFLPKHYGKFGFEETERVKFDWQYAPDGWTAANGEPDVVFMRKAI